jgi:hypothetical protein
VTLPLQAVADPATDQNFRTIGNLFPLQGGSLAKAEIVGAVSSTGSITAGSGFTAEHTATGIYKVTLTHELRSLGVMSANPVVGSPAPLVLAAAPSKKVFEVNTRASLTELKDGAFNFIIKES